MKYKVYGLISASVFVGEYEADSKEEAEQMADEDGEANWNPILCHHCSSEVELGDVYKTSIYGENEE